MPHFCECGADTYICQKCTSIFCSKDYPPSWRPDITGHKQAGNVCPDCLSLFDNIREVPTPKEVVKKRYQDYRAKMQQIKKEWYTKVLADMRARGWEKDADLLEKLIAEEI